MNKIFRIRFLLRPSKIQNTKWIRIVAIAVTFALCGVVAEAQQPTNIPRIGYLATSSLSANAARIEAFRRGLLDLGYVEEKNIVIEYRYADGKIDRLPALAVELVRLKVDIIVSGGPTATRPAKVATNTIPIVMAFDDHPVGNGFVASLARPGGNITGLSTLAPEISGKQLELLKEIIPKLSRVAVFGISTRPPRSAYGIGASQAVRRWARCERTRWSARAARAGRSRACAAAELA